jgi:WD40 repeat protein
VVDLVFSPDGNILASTDNDSIILWSVETRQQLVEITPDYPVFGIEFSPDGKTLASSGCGEVGADGGCIKGEVRLWNVATRQLLGTLIGHTDRIASIAFSPDGRTLASASDISDGTINIWDVATRAPLGRPLTGHVSGVEKVVISPDGETLAAVSNGAREGTYNIVLWDLVTRGRIGQPLVGYTRFVREIAFSPDGRMLASADIGRSLLIWDMSLDSWKASACRVANRNMTHAEWNLYVSDQPYRKTCPDLPEPAAE